MTGSELPLTDDREKIAALVRDLRRFQVIANTATADGQTQAVRTARFELQRLVDGERLRELNDLPAGEVEQLVVDLVRHCVVGELQPFLVLAGLSHPVYNFLAGFDSNAEGPWDRLPVNEQPEVPAKWSVLGAAVKFPVGIAASGLTANARWVEYFSLLGYNVITYKTVRSRETLPHPYPHWVFVEDVDSWTDTGDISTVFGDSSTWPKSLERFSTANSFGVPSPSPEIWQEDVRTALRKLSDGQLLILSVMGTQDERIGLVDDFVKVSIMAAETGVCAIELNLSCPNTVSTDPVKMGAPVCLDVQLSSEIVAAVREALDPTIKLVAKLGYMDANVLRDFLRQNNGPLDAVSLINTAQAPIRRRGEGDESPFVGTADDPSRQRREAGVSGAAITVLAREAVATVSAEITQNAYDLEVIGMGGVMTEDDANYMYDRGVSAVQMVTAACLNPSLAARLAAPHVQGQDAAAPGHASAATSESSVSQMLDHVGEFLRTGGLSILRTRS